VTPRRIERFFKILAQELDGPATAILTGAAAGAILGRVRPSLDIDFAIETARRQPRYWAKVEDAVRRAEKRAGIPAQFAEDIDRWGMITLLDYKRRSRPYRRFGELQVNVMGRRPLVHRENDALPRPGRA
jgi:hypothetical protein